MSDTFRPQTIAESVATELRKQIRSGVCTPGSRPRQMDVAKQFGVSSTAYVSLYLRFSAGSPAALEDHSAIVEACRDRDPERAAELMRAHLRNSLEMVSSGLSEPEE